MITINDGNWKSDIMGSNAGAVLLPVAGKYSVLGTPPGSVVGSKYNMVPHSLKWFLHTYCLKSDQALLTDAAAKCFNITPTFKYHKNLSKTLLMTSIPKEIIPANITITEFFLQSKPSVISLSVCNSLYGYDIRDNLNENFLVNHDDKTIKDSIVNSLIMAVKECVDTKREDLYIAPLFSESGYKPSSANHENEWLDPEQYIRNMLGILDKFEIKPNVHLYYRNYVYENDYIK